MILGRKVILGPARRPDEQATTHGIKSQNYMCRTVVTKLFEEGGAKNEGRESEYGIVFLRV